MNILFLCCAYSESQVSTFQINSIRGYQYAAQNFQEALIEGFVENNDVTFNVVSIPSLSTYPKGYRVAYVPDSSFIYRKNKIGFSFGFINLPIVNHLFQSRIDRHIDNWYNNYSGQKCIIVYAMLKNQMQYAVRAKQRYPDIKLCLVIPDLPIYMNYNKYYKSLGLHKRDMDAIYSYLDLFDCYAVLAEPMIKYLNLVNKSYSVIEGIYSEVANVPLGNKLPYKTIMYAGGIQTRYGVFDLVEAFHRIKSSEYRLILCGPCLEMDKLNSYLSKDDRIDYRGMLSTLEVRKLQKSVSLLVNPRHSTEEFTKYSFPSKTLEYMASGTPVLMSNLPSMPDEYKQYLYLFDDESIDGMKKMIERICSLDSLALNAKGCAAREFILNNKNSAVQVRKIIDLIK